MEFFAGIKEKNYKEAVALMRANNVKEIVFIDENDEQTMSYVPMVVYKGWSSKPVELLIKSVRIDDNDCFFVMSNDDYLTNELFIDFLDYDTDNNVYLAIEEYFKEMKKK